MLRFFDVFKPFYTLYVGVWTLNRQGIEFNIDEVAEVVEQAYSEVSIYSNKIKETKAESLPFFPINHMFSSNDFFASYFTNWLNPF